MRLYPGPHQTSMRLMSVDLWGRDATPKVIVSDRPSDESQVNYVGEYQPNYKFKGLLGIFTISLPQNCFR